MENSPNKLTPDRHQLNFLLGISQVFKNILLKITPSTGSQRLLVHISENLLLKVGEFTIKYIESFEAKDGK
jgi:hypothetical protein